jgi:predicted acyltransferase
MFWIVSGEGIFHGLANVVMENYSLSRNPHDWTIGVITNLSLLERVIIGISNQLHHSPWNGFTFYDLIFPLFIFISGVSMPFSYNSAPISRAGSTATRRKHYFSLIRRTLLLILLGMIVNGLLQWQSYESTRFASVLGRIGLACFFAAIIYLNCSVRSQMLWFVGILVGYWGLMRFVPVPGYGAGVLTPEGNLSAYLDREFLPGKLHRIVYDPEGLLSTMPAVASALLGVFTGQFLKWRTSTTNPLQKLFCLITAGIILLALGGIWNFSFPINKNMWTSSFVLFAGGWSLLLLALFYGLIEVAGYKYWSMPFVWIGVNSILIYIATHGIFNFESTAQFFFGGIISRAIGAWQQFLLWTGVFLIQLKLLHFLYIKKWFLKL